VSLPLTGDNVYMQCQRKHCFLFAVFFVFLFVTSEAETKRRKFRRVFNVVLIILGD